GAEVDALGRVAGGGVLHGPREALLSGGEQLAGEVPVGVDDLEQPGDPGVQHPQEREGVLLVEDDRGLFRRSVLAGTVVSGQVRPRPILIVAGWWLRHQPACYFPARWGSEAGSYWWPTRRRWCRRPVSERQGRRAERQSRPARE